ncbi:hypothetical protein ABOONEI_848 [Aciduliprofundum boonei T469]|nr:hypothetical protein ABOONEI_848 [Aciduliprofundum boonei T469]
MEPRELAEELGYKIVYIPHEEIKDYIACYRVIYEGKEIYPPAALRLGIPLNEIWISDAFRDYEKYILFHELREIAHRAEGYNVNEAHLLALKDEKMELGNDEKWKRLKREINVCPLEELLSTSLIGKKLAIRIMENRPYESMEELRKVRGIGEKRLSRLQARFCALGKLIK